MSNLINSRHARDGFAMERKLSGRISRLALEYFNVLIKNAYKNNARFVIYDFIFQLFTVFTRMNHHATRVQLLIK